MHAIPLVDTDALNANLALLGLHLLRKHHPDILPQLDLGSEATAAGLEARPPCRWEEHTYREPRSGAVVDVVLDMGHNPAALAALARRIAHKFPGREVRCASPACSIRTRWATYLTLHNLVMVWCLYRMVYAMSRDKDVRTCLKNVLAVVPPSHIHFVQVSRPC